MNPNFYSVIILLVFEINISVSNRQNHDDTQPNIGTRFCIYPQDYRLWNFTPEYTSIQQIPLLVQLLLVK